MQLEAETEDGNVINQRIKNVKVSWKPPDENVAGFYVNEYMENDLVKQRQQLDSSEPFHIITNTLPAKEYYVEVWAYNSDGTEGSKAKSMPIASGWIIILLETKI